MDFDQSQIRPYETWSSELLPLNIWNKQTKVKGKNGKSKMVLRGKTPLDTDWTNKRYTIGAHTKWINKGLNIGFKISSNQLVIDIDPRHFEPGVDSLSMVADSLGYFDFDELLESGDYPIGITGGGGYHIYGRLPKGVDYRKLCEVVKGLPGVEFKRKGRQVVACGSKHPETSKFYVWHDIEKVKTHKELPIYPKAFINTVKRKKPNVDFAERSKDGHKTAAGILSGQQLKEHILDNINVDEYDSNTKWYPILAASHYITAGEGVEEFIEWSTGAIGYEDDETIIRNRWESLSVEPDDFDDERKPISVGTLIDEIEFNGNDTRDLRMILQFAQREKPFYQLDDEDSEDGFDDDDFDDFIDGDNEWLESDFDDFDDQGNQDEFELDELDDDFEEKPKTRKQSSKTAKRSKDESNDGANAKAVKEINQVLNFEKAVLKKLEKALDEVDIDKIAGLPKGTHKKIEKGTAIELAKELPINATFDDKLKMIRIIRLSDEAEAAEAIEILKNRKVMNRSYITEQLKIMQNKVEDSLIETVSNLLINSVFNNGKHIIVEPSGIIYIYNDAYWQPITEDYIGGKALQQIDYLKKRIKLNRDEVTIANGVVSTIKKRCAKMSSLLFNANQVKAIINCQNGELWINQDGGYKLRKHSYKSYLTYCLDVVYDPKADCPMFHEALDGIFALYDDKNDLIRHVWEILGYTITPYKNIASWFLFRGDGGDGKSSIIKVLNAVLGDNMNKVQQSILGVGGLYGNSHATHGFQGKLSLVIEELQKGVKLNDSGLKLFSEMSKMRANPKGKDEYNFVFTANLIMCANFWPKIADTSEGIQRRANIIPFNRQFNKLGIENPKLIENIIQDQDEISGVLNHMLAGLKRVVSRGKFLPSASCIKAKNIWLNNASNSTRFINECLEPILDENGDHDENSVGGLALELYREYIEWAEIEGIRFTGRNTFYQELETNGVKIKNSHNHQKHFYGYKFVKTFDEFQRENYDDFEDDL